MYERFTDRAMQVMQFANEEAHQCNHEYIGTEHILLGLVKEGSGVAANVLKNLNVDLRKIQLDVERIVLAGPHKVYAGQLPLTPYGKNVIESAIEEGRSLGHNYVGTEHLLLGLLRAQEGVAAQVLMNLGLMLEDVRAEVQKVNGQVPTPEGTEELFQRMEELQKATLETQELLLGMEALRKASHESADGSGNELPTEFAGLDTVIGKLLGMREQAVRARKFVEAAWYAEQIERLRQVREAIERRFRDS